MEPQPWWFDASSMKAEMDAAEEHVATCLMWIPIPWNRGAYIERTM